jgi:hypothetical protein
MTTYMKRSEINIIQHKAKKFLTEMHFHLPPWAYWSPIDWEGKSTVCSEIFENHLGWDITDFGSGDFYKRGLFLFTLRNGHPEKEGKKYAEKIMIVEEGQETPLHYHWNKTEDIINRGGGQLVLELYNTDENDKPAETDVLVKTDSVIRKFGAGEKVLLRPGESICLEPFMYHRFYAEPRQGRVLAGEVSSVNDDATDNNFLEKAGRFPDIDEDDKPLHLLVSDYDTYIG